jgi:UDP-N-acetylglucosamine/UDP-N-acetylgalactosamine diphosphorylase
LNVSDQGFVLPFNRAEKVVPCIDIATGEAARPSEANVVKLETFVFDALPMTSESVVYEADRADEFAPIKNAAGPGVLDSPATSVQIQVERAATWLERNGASVSRNDDGEVDATIEIKATTALYADDLKHCELPKMIKCGDEVLI